MNHKARWMRRAFAVIPAVGGAVLVLLGLLIWIRPEILNYVVATGFIFAGICLLMMAASARGQIVYRRIDRSEWTTPGR